MKAVLLVYLQASLLHLTPFKLSEDADNIHTSEICTKVGLSLCVCVVFISSVVFSLSLFCLSTGTHGPIRLVKKLNLYNTGTI